ncbi:MAG: hypothetical protein AAF642_19370, partial [Pseudomonadota bacterium]
GIAIIAASVAPLVVVDDLAKIAKPSKIRFIDRMIGARPTVNKNECWLFAHLRTVSHKARPFNVYVKADAADLDPQ